ncbi:MAG: tRNA (adenosine(37)-N6)-dimethylallyltransferase MiaA [Anaerovoracaceae bacterium]|nr:tRNA (adenosine(37)-N6)-dimethylallyltransferase MiaA [Anaerovoracaceae bacterium]
MFDRSHTIIALAGPTASGKTKFAIMLALAFDGEIVSCDSMQLYKYMNIGSAKPTADEMSMAKHHLVDIIDPAVDFSVAQYRDLAKEAIRDIFSRGKTPIVCGGTGLYLNSLLYDMDFSSVPEDHSYREELMEIAHRQGPEALHEMLRKSDPSAAEGIHPNNIVKIVRALERLREGEGSIRQFKDISRPTEDYDVILLGLTRDRAELYDRINRRVDILISEGLEDEVRSLTDMGLSAKNISMKGIGYKEMIDYIDGRCTLMESIENIKKNTRHYAKKQLTWFRRYDKMRWYNVSDYNSDEAAFEDMKTWLLEKK